MADKKDSGERNIGQPAERSQSAAEKQQLLSHSPYANQDNLKVLVAQETYASKSNGLHDVHVTDSAKDSSPSAQVKDYLQHLLPGDGKYNVSFYASGNNVKFNVSGPSTELGQSLRNIISSQPADSELWQNVDKLLKSGHANFNLGKSESHNVGSGVQTPKFDSATKPNTAVDQTAPPETHPAATSEASNYNKTSRLFELGADQSQKTDALLNANVSSDQVPYYPAPRMIGNVSDSGQEYLHGFKRVNIAGHHADINIGNGPNDLKIPVNAEPPMTITAALPPGQAGDVTEVSGYLFKDQQERKYFCINQATVETKSFINGRETIQRQELNLGHNRYYDFVPLKGPHER